MPSQDHYENISDGLKKIYKQKIKPLEEAYLFESFYSPPLHDIDIEAKPMVLLLGQYSVGKTSFIEYLLGKEYPGAHIGPEPTTDRFVAVMHGEDDRVVPGNVATVQSDMPFSGLNKFGGGLLGKFQVSQTNASILQMITLIDSPGVLSGDQQRLGRSYDYSKVCEWFAERSDLILLLFDAHKLDISEELKRVISGLQKYDDKLRIVLNKADTISNQELMRVYGALMWSLGKVIQTPEVIRVYIGSFWDHQKKDLPHSDLLLKEQSDLLYELDQLPKNAAIRKLNDIIKRARQVKVHAYVCDYLRGQMPSLFGRAAKQDRLIKNLSEQFQSVQKQYNLPQSDFPEISHFQECLRKVNLDGMPKLSSTKMSHLENALGKDLPLLMQKFPQTSKLLLDKVVNPFTGQTSSLVDAEGILEFEKIDHEGHRKIFLLLNPKNEVISGVEAKMLLAESGLEQKDLGYIWSLSDLDHDGGLNFDEFSIALHLIKLKKNGYPLPSVIPDSLKPIKLSN